MSKTSPKLDLSKVGRTNLYPPDEERWLIDEAIRRTTEALQRVREEKRAIILREEALQSDLERYISAFAPIKRLPDNILCKIFEWRCQVVDIPFSSSSIPPQITISHVCSTWRQIVLHTPLFWRNIRLVSDLATDMGKEADVAHAWLSRAKSLPCSVEIEFESSSWSHEVRQLDSYQNIVKDLISLYNLKKLHLTFPDCNLQDLFQLPQERLCCIEDLSLRKVDLMDTSSSENVLPFELHKFSSLTSFSLSGSRLEISRMFGIVPEDGSRFASIPWHQLWHIKFYEAFPMHFCLRMLELSSVLETCSLDVYVDSSFMSSSLSSLKDSIYCSHLREFKVDIYSPSATATIDSVPGANDIILDPFLCSLQCPKLKSLTVGSIEPNPRAILPRSINFQTFLRMQHVSGMRLEELIIYNTTACDLEVLPLLESFPSLRCLVLPKTINFTDEAMDALGSGYIAPLLEDLTINKALLDLERLFQMIKTRSSVGQLEDSKRKYKPTPFKSVILDCEGSARKEYIDTVQEINQSGVNLTVDWGDYLGEESCRWLSYFDEDYDEDNSDSYEW